MLISKELRKTNIAEYLLYMWQVEDLIRANGFNTDSIVKAVGLEGKPAEFRAEWERWYYNLIEMMTAEGVRENGHLQINKNVLIMLTDLHNRLLDSKKAEDYHSLYYSALPIIVEFREKEKNTEAVELENCFDLMYGVWMLRLQGREISQATAQGAKLISDMLSRLAQYYILDKEGSLDLDDDDE